MQTYQVLIIGSGFGGQCAAVNLLKAGITTFACSNGGLLRRHLVPEHLSRRSGGRALAPVLAVLRAYRWTQMFAEQAELHRYTACRRALRPARPGGTAGQCRTRRMGRRSKRWAVHTGKGTFYAQFLINATGPLSQPVVPRFEGQDRFQGKTFHTNNWDHTYDYRGKRVAIVGSGASAAQVIPAIAPDVEHLHVFQRTPHWVLPRADRSFGRFQRWLLGETSLQAAALADLLAIRNPGDCLQILETGDTHGPAPGLAFLKRQVPDAELARKLTPDFTIGCKRVIAVQHLYPALTRPNVTLHSREQGIAAR
jgi:cation diffusion facilitator CzcD-associated flavoprotein CzcO